MPAIHILAGEKVCIQAMTPMQASSALAASTAARMASRSLRTGFHTIGTGTASASSSQAATCRDCSATRARVSSP